MNNGLLLNNRVKSMYWMINANNTLYWRPILIIYDLETYQIKLLSVRNIVQMLWTHDTSWIYKRYELMTLHEYTNVMNSWESERKSMQHNIIISNCKSFNICTHKHVLYSFHKLFIWFHISLALSFSLNFSISITFCCSSSLLTLSRWA